MRECQISLYVWDDTKEMDFYLSWSRKLRFATWLEGGKQLGEWHLRLLEGWRPLKCHRSHYPCHKPYQEVCPWATRFVSSANFQINPQYCQYSMGLTCTHPTRRPRPTTGRCPSPTTGAHLQWHWTWVFADYQGPFPESQPNYRIRSTQTDKC